MKKILFLILCLCSFVLMSCGNEELDAALEKIQTTSYTANLEMTMSMKFGWQTTTISSVAIMEADPTQVYMETVTDTGYSGKQTVYSYVKIEENTVKVYTKNLSWLMEEVSIDDYKSENELMNIDTKNTFKLEDGIYVGDVEKLNDQLGELLKEEISESLGMDADINIDLTKYNITLENDNVKKIEIDMNANVKNGTQTVDMTMTMVYEFSKIGETTVTVPANLPTN